MPNTLAHIGLHTLLIGIAGYRRVHLLPILLGCIIPDIPWIVRRALETFEIFDLHQLYAYGIAQASLFISAILALALALEFRNWIQAWALLVAGSALHLIIDALQVKWGNGVHLLAPFDWTMLQLNVWEMDSASLYAVTAAGVVPFLLYRFRADAETLHFTGRRIVLSIACLGVYFGLPAFFIQPVIESDSYFLGTTSPGEHRTGKYVEFDRKSGLVAGDAYWLVTHTGERLRLTNAQLPEPGNYSVRGVFRTPIEVHVLDWKRHTTFRDVASVVGLALSGLWIVLVLAYIATERMGRE